MVLLACGRIPVRRRCGGRRKALRLIGGAGWGDGQGPCPQAGPAHLLARIERDGRDDDDLAARRLGLTLEARKFQALGQYQFPSLPAEKAVKQVVGRLRAVIKAADEQPMVESSDLDRIGRRELDEIAAPPACKPLLDGLDATFDEWLEDPSIGRSLQLVVLPPCDETGLLTVWAGRRRLDVLGPPPREVLTGMRAEVPDLDGDGVLVIPALEAWFLRRTGGLDAVRRLLAVLGRTERRCIVGCNSWAWMFLRKVADAGALLPGGLTFQAFDGPRLQHWFGELSRDLEGEATAFRLSETGMDVFAAEAEGRQNYFVQLAAQSLGIPWVAWRMWRDALRDVPDGENLEVAEEFDGRTYWIAAPEIFSLPLEREGEVILTFHAILLHGALTEADLASVLPTFGSRNTVAQLLNARLIRRVEGKLRCNPVAYPSVRSALSDAGVNLDRL